MSLPREMLRGRKVSEEEDSTLSASVAGASVGASAVGASMSDAEKVCVAVRVRPMNKRETESGAGCVVTMNPTKREVYVVEEPQGFSVDLPLWSIAGEQALDGSSSLAQDGVYARLGEPLLLHALEGYNSTILAYGQTGSGKTYSMMGQMNDDDRIVKGTEGVIPRLCVQLFEEIARRSVELQDGSCYAWDVKAMFVEIYCEKVTDLLSKSSEVTIRQDGGFFKLQGARRVTVGSVGDVLEALRLGNANRRVQATKMNDRSSRSHAVFVLDLVETLNLTLPDGTKASAPSKKVSIKLVDLAGSERVNESGVTGQGLKEAASINLSLFTLGQVIEALTDPKKKVTMRPPYRNSALTKILKDSFGGNSKTTLIATVGPTETYRSQTVQTLNYATRARKITNKPTVEEDPQAAELRRKQQELDEVRRQLDIALRNGGGGGRSDELEAELRETQDRMRQEQEDAQRIAREMAQREAELVEQLEAKADMERRREEELAAMEAATKLAIAQTEERERDLAAARHAAEERAEKQQQQLQAQLSEMNALADQQKELEARVLRRQEELQARQTQAEEEAQKKEDELKQKQEAIEHQMRKRLKVIKQKQEALEQEAKKREQELLDRQHAAEEQARTRDAELAERQQAAEEEAKKREAELVLRQRTAEEEAKQRESELVLRQQAAEEEAKKREAELVERQQAAEEEAKQRETELLKRQRSAKQLLTLKEEQIAERQLAADAKARRLEEELQAREEAAERTAADRDRAMKERMRALTAAEEDATKQVEKAKRLEKEMRQKEALLLREAESAQRNADEISAKLQQLTAKISEANEEITAKNRQLEEKERQRLEQEEELRAKTERLRDEMEHRQNGVGTATTLTDDLLEQLHLWKGRYTLLRKQRKVQCPACTSENDWRQKSCTVCSAALNV